MRISPQRVLPLGLIALCAFGQPQLLLKTRLTAQPATDGTASPLRSLESSRRHWLIQFAEPPQAADVETLQLRGARIVGPVPEWGFVINAEPDLNLGGLNLLRVEPIGVRDKLSPDLGPARRGGESVEVPGAALESSPYLVEFHADVASSDARRVLTGAGLRVIEHAQLLDRHYVVEARRDQLERLAEWDEIAYIFPASPDLAANIPVNACYGAVTANGPVGQSVVRVGPGWAPGKGSARLSYALGALSQKLDPVRLKQEIQRALGEWSKYVQVDFTETGQLAGLRTLAFRWGRGVNGGPLPFDGPGKVLAYTYYPAPPNPEPLAGDLYFDDDENWQFGPDIDAYSVILHEIGHALGLGHSDRPGAVMYPYYRKASNLTDEDIGAIREMYATRNGGTVPTPPTSEPTPPVNPVAPTPAPQPPAPTPQPPTAPAPPPTGDTTPPTLALTSPLATTVTTSMSAISIVGTAYDASGIARVTWSNASGGSGVAQGTAQWRADVPLIRGINSIAIRAFDAAGNASWRSLVVTRR